MPKTWSDHQATALNYPIDPAYINRAKQMVYRAIDDGLCLIRSGGLHW
ncbi:hypothetical protein AB0D13_38645 [Streptomyces sp. NPDC048430]